MAGKNQVTLTFAGDSDQLEKAVANVGDSTRKMEADVRSSAGGISRVLGEGGRSFGQYGTGLGGLGDRADEVDTRMMGLSDGIQGVSDLMRAEQLRPHEFAMAFSDLGSSMYNTVIPSLQDVGGKIGNLGSRMKEGVSNAGGFTGSLKKMAPTMLGVASAAGVAVIAFQAWQSQQARARQRTEETRQALEDRNQAIRRRVGHKVHLTADGDTGMGIDGDFFIEHIHHSWPDPTRWAGDLAAVARLAVREQGVADRGVEPDVAAAHDAVGVAHEPVGILHPLSDALVYGVLRRSCFDDRERVFDRLARCRFAQSERVACGRRRGRRSVVTPGTASTRGYECRHQHDQRPTHRHPPPFRHAVHCDAPPAR